MALTLNGSIFCPTSVRLWCWRSRVAISRRRRSGQILEQTADALCDVMADVKRYFSEVAAHPEIGDRMLNAWETGIAMSLERSDPACCCYRRARRQEAAPKAKAPPEGGAKALIGRTGRSVTARAG